MSLTFGYSSDRDEKLFNALIKMTQAHFQNWSFYAQLYMYRKLVNNDFDLQDIIVSQANDEEQPCLAGLLGRWKEHYDLGKLASFQGLHNQALQGFKQSLSAKYAGESQAVKSALMSGMRELDISLPEKSEFVPSGVRFRG